MLPNRLMASLMIWKASSNWFKRSFNKAKFIHIDAYSSYFDVVDGNGDDMANLNSLIANLKLFSSINS